MKEGPNIVKLLDVVRDPSSKTPCLVFEWIDHTDFKVLFPKFNDFDIRYYIFEVLRVNLSIYNLLGFRLRSFNGNYA